MEILVVMPKYFHSGSSNEVNYHYFFPIGLSYIYSVIKENGYNVEPFNLNHEEGKITELIQRKLDSKKYDVVCTGGMTIDYAVIEKIMQACRSHGSKPKLILGGAVLTSSKEIVAKNLDFDVGVIGEGEVTIIEVLEHLEKNKELKEIDGICYKENGEIKFNSPREQIMKLDELPFPDYGAFGFDKVLDNMDPMLNCLGVIDYPRTYPILGSRGCPFQCTFCYHSIGSKYRKRSIKNIIQEIKFAIEKYNINSFNLNDDLFSADKERLYEFCREIKKINEGGKNLSWMCQLWVGAIDEKMLETLKDAGCLSVSLGFESYSEDVLKSMKKPITPKQIDEAIQLCMKAKMPIIGNFIFGDIAETKETARKTLDYWKENCKGQVKLFFIHPYPGSEIYANCLKKGIIKDELNFMKNEIHHTYIRNMTSGMNDEEFEQLKKEVYDLTRTNIPYKVPFRIKKEKDSRYELSVRCPFCNEQIIFRNCFIRNKNFFSAYLICKNCKMKYNVCSRLYKFTIDHYLKLDFLRRNYLILRERFLRGRA